MDDKCVIRISRPFSIETIYLYRYPSLVKVTNKKYQFKTTIRLGFTNHYYSL